MSDQAGSARRPPCGDRTGRETLAAERDPRLTGEPAARGAAGSASFLARQNARLEAELRARAAELADTRSRLVLVADRERARIERDLHDGAQQRLVAVRIELGLVEECARELSESVARVLARVGENVEAAIDDIRRLAHGIYPHELDQFGLEGALAALAREMPFDVRIHGSWGSRLATDAETTVYFCCMEAVQNVTKHGGAGARVDLRLFQHADGSLGFEVADDGVGFEPERVADSYGITSMHDRLAALGGELTISSSPGAGTRVTGRVPAASLRNRSPARGHASRINQ